jgi:hypothetical protein
MARERQFRVLLPIAQCGMAAIFGGIGLCQRSAILNRPFFGQTGWQSTAVFHVWPWPYKFAVISSAPAFITSAVLLWPIGVTWPRLPEYIQHSPSLLFVLLLWYWVGKRLDQRWSITNRIPWIALFAFTSLCLLGALLPIGYVGYLPYGVMLWATAGVVIARFGVGNPMKPKATAIPE